MGESCSIDTQESFLPEPPPGAVYDDDAGVCRPAEPLESLPPPAENPTSFAQGDPACNTHLISRNDHFNQPGVTKTFCFHDPSLDMCFDPNNPVNDRDGLRQSASCDPTQREEGQLYVQHVLKKDPERVAVAVNEINQNPPPEGVEAVRQAVQVALQEVGSEGNAGKAAVTAFAQTVSDPELRRLAVAAAIGTTPPTREGNLAGPGDESSSSAMPPVAIGAPRSVTDSSDVGSQPDLGPQATLTSGVAWGPPLMEPAGRDSSPGPNLSISGVAPVDTSIQPPTLTSPDALALSRGAVPGQGAGVVLRSLVQEPSENEGEKSDRAGELGIDVRRNPTRRGETDFAARIERAGTGSEGLSRHPARTLARSSADSEGKFPAEGGVDAPFANKISDTGESPTFHLSQGLQPRGNEIDGAPVGMAMASGGELDPYTVAFAPVPPSLFVPRQEVFHIARVSGDGRRGTSDRGAPQTIADKGHSSDHHGEDGMGDPDGRRRQGGGEDHPEEEEDPQYAWAPEEEAETPPAA